MDNSLIDLGINGALLLIAIGLFLAVAFFIFHSITNIKESWKGLVGIVGVLLFMFIMYSMAPGEITGVFKTAKYSWLTPGTMKMVTAGVNGALGLMALGVISWVVLEIVNLFK